MKNGKVSWYTRKLFGWMFGLSAGYGMNTDRIAEVINAEQLHIRADGNLVTSAQVYAAVCRNPATFIKEEGRIRLMI